MDINEYLKQLVIKALAEPSGSLGRRRYLTEIIRTITNSGRLWRDSSPYYEDALQKTWEHLCRKLDEYDPNRASLITWLNQYLKWRLSDIYREYIKNKELQKRYQQDYIRNRLNSRTENSLDLQKLREWVRTDPQKVLSTTHIRHRPEINCQMLVLRKIESEITWEKLAAEQQVNSKTLTSFYYRKCLPLLRKFLDGDDFYV